MSASSIKGLPYNLIAQFAALPRATIPNNGAMKLQTLLVVFIILLTVCAASLPATARDHSDDCPCKCVNRSRARRMCRRLSDCKVSRCGGGGGRNGEEDSVGRMAEVAVRDDDDDDDDDEGGKKGKRRPKRRRRRFQCCDED